MTSKALFCIALSTICGMVASIGLSQWLDQSSGAAGKRQVQERIFVAHMAIEPGTVLSHENLRLAAWDSNVIPNDAIRQLDQVVGMVSSAAMQPGDAIQQSSVITADEYAVRQRKSEASESPAKVDAAPAIAKESPSLATAQPASPFVAPTVPAAPSPAPSPSPSPAPTEAAAEAVAVPAAPPSSSTPSAVAQPAELVSADVSTNDAAAKADQASETKISDVQEPTPPRPSIVRRSTDRPVSTVTEARTDDGWVKTYSRSNGSKVLRWRPDGDAPAAESAGKSSGGRSSSGVERTARPTADPRKS